MADSIDPSIPDFPEQGVPLQEFSTTLLDQIPIVEISVDDTNQLNELWGESFDPVLWAFINNPETVCPHAYYRHPVDSVRAATVILEQSRRTNLDLLNRDQVSITVTGNNWVSLCMRFREFTRNEDMKPRPLSFMRYLRDYYSGSGLVDVGLLKKNNLVDLMLGGAFAGKNIEDTIYTPDQSQVSFTKLLKRFSNSSSGFGVISDAYSEILSLLSPRLQVDRYHDFDPHNYYAALVCLEESGIIGRNFKERYYQGKVISSPVCVWDSARRNRIKPANVIRSIPRRMRILAESDRSAKFVNRLVTLFEEKTFILNAYDRPTPRTFGSSI